MAKNNYSLNFDASIRANTDDVRKIIQNLQNQLNNLQIPQNASKGFEKSIERLNAKLNDFDQLTTKSVNSLSDNKKVQQSWNEVVDILNTINNQIINLGGNIDSIVPKQLLNNIKTINKAMDEYQKKVEVVRKSQEYQNKNQARQQKIDNRNIVQSNYDKEIDRYNKKQSQYEAQRKTWESNYKNYYENQKSQIVEAKKQIEDYNIQIQDAINQQQELIKSQKVKVTQKGTIDTRWLENTNEESQAYQQALQNYEEYQKALKKAKNSMNSYKGLYSKALKNEESTDTIQKYSEKLEKAKSEYEKLLQQSQRFDEIKQQLNNGDTGAQKREDANTYNQLIDKIKIYKETKKQIQEQLKSLQEDTTFKEASKSESTLSKSETELKNMQTTISNYQMQLQVLDNEIQQLDSELKNLEFSGSTEDWNKLVDIFQNIANIDISNFNGDITEVTKALNDYKTGQIKDMPELLKKIAESAKQVQSPVQKVNDELKNMGDSAEELQRAQQEMERLKDQIFDFFSISNTIQIFKNAINDALNTVKELDAVMTETAVVTDFSIGDMWEKLPEYSDYASQLGVSIKDLYGATTLYYQQGLKTQAAMDLGIETMKMAKIANMEASESTQAMTAALRGFNMELNQTSATRINDVYSELAAITAADTQQIATAMTKTASIASSANMEFETTAAFLSQIIETTQEAPETAGTALKTIIARFTEVKSLFDQGMLTGTDSEGEAIEINKIDTALKSVGISLRSFLAGEQGLDDILLELASKWDTLDISTQRYIATTAAGSRQQSRFLAMMSDYSRTLELVNAANNSAGASQKQYDKTLESLDTKIQRLNNAWDQFTMGLANNKVLKGAVDGLTQILETVNSITESFGELGGSLSKILLLIGALKAGKGIYTSLIGKRSIGQNTQPNTSSNNNMFGAFNILFNKQSNIDQTAELKTLATNWQVVASSMMVAGLAFDAVAEKADNAGYKEWANGLRLIGTTATVASIGLTAAAKAASILNVSTMSIAGPLGIIIALISVVGLVTYQAYKNAEKLTGAFKLDNAEKQLSRINSELEDTSEQIDEITSKKTELESMYSTLDSLTAGTTEWKNELIKVNNEVLSLIEKYPDLMVKYGQDGILKIDEESWNNLIERQEQAIFDLQQNQYRTQQQKNDALVTSEYDIISDLARQNAYSRAVYSHSSFLTESQLLVFLDKLEQNGIPITGEIGTTWDDNIDLITDLYRESLGRITPDDYMYVNILQDLLQEQPGIFADYINANQDRINKNQIIDLQAIQNAITNTELGQNRQDVAAIATLIANSQQYQEYQNIAKDEISQLTELERKRAYAGLFAASGYRLKGTTIVNDQGEEVDIEMSDIDSALIGNRVDEMLTPLTESIVNFIDRSELSPDIANALIGNEGAGITDELISKYVKDGQLQLNDIIGDYNINFENSPITQDEFSNTLKTNFQNAIDGINKDRESLIKKMSTLLSEDNQKTLDTYQGLNLAYTNLAQLLAHIESKGEGSEMRAEFDSVLTSLGSLEDKKFASQAFTEFAAQGINLDVDEFKELSSLISNINWNNPIKAMQLLQEEAKYGSEVTKKYAEYLVQLSNTSISASEQIKYLFTSTEYKDTVDGIREIIETQDDLSGDDVLDLAESYDVLNTLLENTSITAEGLAKILEGISSNELDLSSITDFIIAAASGINKLDEEVKGVVDKLGSFDFGTDENQVNEFLSSAAEIAVQNAAAGNFNNTQYNKVAELMFGKDWDKGLSRDERISKLIAGSKSLYNQSQIGNWSQLYDQAYSNINYAGEPVGITREELMEKYGGLYISKDAYGEGSYGIEGYEGKSWDQLVSFLMEAAGTSKEFAEAALVDMRQQDSNFDNYMNQLDYENGVESSINTLTNIIGKDGLQRYSIDESQLQIVADMYGKTLDEVKSTYTSLLDNLSITDYYKEDGSLKEISELVKEFGKIVAPDKTGSYDINKLKENYAISYGSSGQLIDFTNLSRDIQNSGMPQEIQLQVALAIAQGFNEGLKSGTTELQTINENGIPITVTIDENDTVESLQQKISKASYEANVDIQTNALVDAMQSVFGEAINLTVNDEEVTNKIEELENTNPEISVTFSPISSSVDSVIEYLKGEEITIPVTFSNESAFISGTSSRTKTSSNIRFMANGIKNSKTNFGAIVGDGNGPELIMTKDSAYIGGLNGPEYVNIHKNDTIFTAEETKKIFKNNDHTPIPRFYHGYGQGVDITGGSSGGSSSRSSNDDNDIWENTFDKLYNLVRKIDEELRQRERIERRYEKLIEGIDASASKIVFLSRESLAQLEKERMLQEQLITGRQYQIQKYQEENSSMTKYGNVVQNDRGESILRINWDLINSVTDPDEGQRIEDYIGQLEEWFDSLEEAEDALWEIEDTVDEIKQRGEDEYFDLEDAIKEALIQSYQDQIDKLSDINNSINDTNISVLDAIQNSIDKQRQDRDNQRTEEDLVEKQRRLLYLQQDTSGANALDILSLQEEIAQGQEDYTDTLIDQKISELQQQNNEAAKQREQQITLAQSQLDHYIETGRIWQEVYQLMADGLDDENGLLKGSKLEEILKNADNFSGLSAIGQQEWWNDYNNMIAQALAYLEVGRQLEDIGITNQEIQFTDQNGQVLTGKVDSNGNVTASNGKVYNNVYQGFDGKYYAGENIADVEKPVVEGPSGGSSSSSGNNTNQSHNNPYGKASEQGFYSARGGTKWSSGVKAIQWALQDMGYYSGEIDGGYGYMTSQAVQKFQRDVGIAVDGDYGPDTREQMRLKGYKEGGLADFTGLAWLDGTKAKPESVLDAQDTKNFIVLKDVLSSILNNTTNRQNENNGITNYDIDINVDKLENDYDVDKIANRIKMLITNDARYRNNNTVSFKK